MITIMKHFFSFAWKPVAAVALMSLVSCAEQEFAEPDSPDVQVLVNGNFENEYEVPLGPEFKLEDIFEPATDELRYYWTLNGEKMFEGSLSFSYIFEEEGDYTLEFVAYKQKYMDVFTTKLIVRESSELIVTGAFDENGYEIEDGDRLVINSIKAYPSEATVTWTMDGKEIGTGHVLEYMGEISQGEHDLVYKATYKDKTETIETTVKVVPGLDYGSYRNILIGVLPETGNISDIDWDYITHLYLPITGIGNDGSIIKKRTDNSIHEIIAMAREKRVQVILSLNGKMNTVSGVGDTGERTMGEVLVDDTKRAKLISDAVTMMYGFKFNGIDLNYTEWQDGNFGALTAEEETRHNNVKDGITKFFNEIEPSLSDTKLLTLSVPAITQQAGTNIQERQNYYDFTSFIDKIDWVNVMQWYKTSFTAGPDVLAWNHSGWWQTNSSYCDTEIFIKWNQAGVPMEKLVLGFPLFGVRIGQLNAYLDWGNILIETNQYDPFWVSYKDLEATPGFGYEKLWTYSSYVLAADGKMNNNNGLMPYCPDGVPGRGYFWDPKEVVDAKLEYVLGEASDYAYAGYNNTVPLKGAMLYGLDGDMEGEKSVVRYCFGIMNPRDN